MMRLADWRPGMQQGVRIAVLHKLTAGRAGCIVLHAVPKWDPSLVRGFHRTSWQVASHAGTEQGIALVTQTSVPTGPAAAPGSCMQAGRGYSTHQATPAKHSPHAWVPPDQVPEQPLGRRVTDQGQH